MLVIRGHIRYLKITFQYHVAVKLIISITSIKDTLIIRDLANCIPLSYFANIICIVF